MSANVISLDTKLAAAGGRPSGFDHLRIVLASGIIIWHTVIVCNGAAYETALWNGYGRAFLGLLLPMFFSLSGFLVAGSFKRSGTIPGFLYLRAIRIFPALLVETTLSALILGVVFTNLDLKAYLESNEFFLYFLNIIGNIHYYLPGVFVDNPLPRIVNGQLWTVPYELRCYIAVALLALFGLAGKRQFLAGAFAFLQIVMFQRAYVYGDPPGPVPGNVLVLCFLAGFLGYLYKERIAYSKILFGISLATHAMLFYIPLGSYFIAIPDAYIMLFIGLKNMRRSNIVMSGDYSYGIYLYGCVIQQAVAALGPWGQHWPVNLAISAPLIALCSALSWHGLEKHVLRMRRYAPVIDRFIAASPLSMGLLTLHRRSVERRVAVARPGNL